jgi:hypothetical protein
MLGIAAHRRMRAEDRHRATERTYGIPGGGISSEVRRFDPHAVRAHVAERHRLDRFIDSPGYHPAIVGCPAAVGGGGTVLRTSAGGPSKRKAPRGSKSAR